MFDQKDVEAYRRIKAPEELREQVMRCLLYTSDAADE